MCDCPSETLGSLILAAVRQSPGIDGKRLLESLGREKVCLIHFCGAIQALSRKEYIRSGDPDTPIRPGMGPTRLIRLTLVPGDAAVSVALERRIDILRDLWDELPRALPEEKVLLLDKRFKVFLSDILGRGGTGAVYRGEQVSLARRVAVKIISLDRLPPSVPREVYLQRFEREPKILAALNHPHIVQVIDGGREGDLLWHVMEYLEGGTLAGRVEREGALPAPTVLEYMLSVAEALEAAASRGIQHRDVKPENIFNAGMKLADFGLAKMSLGSNSGGKELTRAGSILGTFPYLAPERAALEPGDDRSDLYSLGAAMYYAASGNYLFEKQNLDRAEWIHHHVSVEPVPLWRRVPEIPRDASKVVHRCLAKDPALRYSSFSELAIELRKLIPSMNVSKTRSIGAFREPAAEAAAPPSSGVETPPAGPGTVISSTLSNMDIEVLELCSAYEERYGAGCWTFNPAFQRALWDLAKKADIVGLCARISQHSGTSFEEHMEEGLKASESGEGTAPIVSGDFRDYVWLALRKAAEQNALGYLADTDPAERLIRFLENSIDDPALRELRVEKALEKGEAPSPRPAPAPEAGFHTPEPSSLVEALESAAPEAGEKAEESGSIGPYEFQGVVGHGGMAVVHRARDKRIGRVVALKILHTTDPEMVGRFRREAQIAGQLKHPGIATIYDVGEEGGHCYIAMQFIDGGAIDALPRPIARALEMIRDAARALQHAHEQGIVHRDVKPGNILVDQGGQVFLTDFGVAKHVRAEGLEALSITGTVLGTPEYMSPEQARGDAKHVDARSDIYSLGATLYTLLARRPPFVNPNVGDLLFEVVKKKAPPLRQFNPRVSPELELLVERVMSKNPDRRPASMAEFAREIDRLLSERRYEGKYGLAKVLARKWAPAAAAGILLAFGLRYAAPAWSEYSTSPVVDSVEDLYRAARMALGSIEREASRTSPDQRRLRLNREVFHRLDDVLRRQPSHLGAKVSRVRALFVDAQTKAAAEQLQAVAAFASRDYRITYLGALLALEEELAVPPGLPLPEDVRLSPAPQSGLRAQAIRRDLEAVLKRAPDPALLEEHRRDQGAAAALLPFAGGQWEEAARALEEVLKNQELPVYRKAWCRAAYLAGRYDEVRSSPWSRDRRERWGSKLAVLLREQTEKTAPAPAVEAVNAEYGPDPEAALVAHVAAARQAFFMGGSPEPHVAAALALALPGDPWIRELQGAALVTRLRWEKRSWQDSESDYPKAMALVGTAPVTALGRLTRIESAFCLSRAMARGTKDPRALLKDAIEEANRLSSARPEWVAPRTVRGMLRTELGQMEDAWADLVVPAGNVKPDLQALLAAASLWNALAEREKKSGREASDQARRSQEFSARAISVVPEHPVALTLHSASSLLLVEAGMGRGLSEQESLEGIIRVQERVLQGFPEYIKARIVLATAYFLRGEAARGGSGGARSEGHDTACRHLTLVLEKALNHPQALYLRGLIRFLSDERELAAEDWTTLIAQHPRWDNPELREWLRRAKEGERHP